MTFGLAPAGIDAEAKNTTEARSPAETNLISLLKIIVVLPDGRRRDYQILSEATTGVQNHGPLRFPPPEGVKTLIERES